MPVKQDFILRMIERAGRALARALGKQAEGEDDEALQALGEAYDALLTMDRELFDRLDAKSLASMLGPPEVVRMIARVCKADAQSLERQGQAALAKQRRRRAIELYLAVGVGDDPDDQTALVELHRWLKQH